MATTRMHQAVETFVAELADGSAVRVAKGEVFHSRHELVKRDKNNLLFRPLDSDAATGPPAADDGEE